MNPPESCPRCRGEEFVAVAAIVLFGEGRPDDPKTPRSFFPIVAPCECAERRATLGVKRVR
jgi:hypothetical protein